MSHNLALNVLGSTERRRGRRVHFFQSIAVAAAHVHHTRGRHTTVKPQVVSMGAATSERSCTAMAASSAIHTARREVRHEVSRRSASAGVPALPCTREQETASHAHFEVERRRKGSGSTKCQMCNKPGTYSMGSSNAPESASIKPINP